MSEAAKELWGWLPPRQREIWAKRRNRLSQLPLTIESDADGPLLQLGSMTWFRPGSRMELGGESGGTSGTLSAWN
jgi:hypothetical protein